MFTNPDNIHLDKVYVKVTKIEDDDRNEVKGRWKIKIDGEQTDVTFDHNYEAEIEAKGFKIIRH